MDIQVMVLEKFNHPLTLKSFPLPKLQEGDILVKIEAAGVCGSDVHMWEGRGPADPSPHDPGTRGRGGNRRDEGGEKGRLRGSLEGRGQGPLVPGGHLRALLFLQSEDGTLPLPLIDLSTESTPPAPTLLT